MPTLTTKKIIQTCCPAPLKPLLDRIEASNIGYRLVKGTFWSVAGAIISRGLMFIASIFVARMLGKTSYGELGIIQSTVGMFGVFAGFGLGLTATKYVAEFRRTNPERAGRIIGLSGLIAIASGSIIAIGLYVFSPWLAEHTINAPHLTRLLKISAIMLFISALTGAQTGVLSGFESFKTIAHVNLFTGLLSFPILIVGTYFGGLTGAVWALTINLGVNWLINHFFLRKEARRFNVPFIYKDCSRELSVLWKFSLPAVIASFLVTPITWLCNAILVNQPNGYSEMGILNASNQWRILLMFIPTLILQAVLPVMSETNSRHDFNESFKKTIEYTQFVVVVITIPIGILTICFSDLIMWIYGAEFRNGSAVLIGIVSGTLISSIGAVTGSALQAKGRVWIGVLFNLTYGIVLLVIVVLWARSYGALSIAYGSAVSYLILTLWAFIYLRTDLPKGMLIRVNLLLSFVVGITCICLSLTSTQRHYLAIPIFIGSLAVVFFISTKNTHKNIFKALP